MKVILNKTPCSLQNMKGEYITIVTQWWHTTYKTISYQPRVTFRVFGTWSSEMSWNSTKAHTKAIKNKS